MNSPGEAFMGRRILGRLIVVVLAASVAVAVAPPVAQAARPATATDPSADPRFAHTDWSKALVESTMQRFTPQTLGGWGYTQGLYLYGQYLVFKRTGDPRYLDYIKAWVDRFVRPDGTISNSFNNLDRSEEHTSELQSQSNLVCRLLLEKKKKKTQQDLTDCRTYHQS